MLNLFDTKGNSNTSSNAGGQSSLPNGRSATAGLLADAMASSQRKDAEIALAQATANQNSILASSLAALNSSISGLKGEGGYSSFANDDSTIGAEKIAGDLFETPDIISDYAGRAANSQENPDSMSTRRLGASAIDASTGTPWATILNEAENLIKGDPDHVWFSPDSSQDDALEEAVRKKYNLSEDEKVKIQISYSTKTGEVQRVVASRPTADGQERRYGDNKDIFNLRSNSESDAKEMKELLGIAGLNQFVVDFRNPQSRS